jgi:hypothetical protein
MSFTGTTLDEGARRRRNETIAYAASGCLDTHRKATAIVHASAVKPPAIVSELDAAGQP